MVSISPPVEAELGYLQCYKVCWVEANLINLLGELLGENWTFLEHSEVRSFN